MTRAGATSIVASARERAPLGLRSLHGAAAGWVKVGIVQTAAMLVGGDDVALRVAVGPGAALELVEISGTLAHPGPASSLTIDVEVAVGAVVVLRELPFVVAAGADVRRAVRIALHGDARAVLRDTLVLGRHGEAPGAVASRLRVTRDAVPVVDETVDTSDLEVSGSAAVLGDARVIDALSVFGATLQAPPDAFVLSGSDVLVRRLAPTARATPDLDALVPALALHDPVA